MFYNCDILFYNMLYCLAFASQMLNYLSNTSPFLGCCLLDLSSSAFLGQAEVSPCARRFFHQSWELPM